MSNKLPPEIIEAIEADLRQWAPYVNDTPGLMSVLYDIDLMPEQISHVMDVNPRAAPVNCNRMVAFCMLWKDGHKAFMATSEDTPDAP